MLTTQRISTYAAVTQDGALNPFENVPNVNSYGSTDAEYHAYMLAYHSNLPVFNDFTRLHAQVLRCFSAHRAEWEAMAEATPNRDVPQDLNTPYTLTESTTHSGTDNTTAGSTATDKENTYDNATLRTVRETGTDGSGSTTYGHEVTIEREKWAAGDPIAAMDKILDISYKNGIFTRIINTLLDSISCKIYTLDALCSSDSDNF